MISTIFSGFILLIAAWIVPRFIKYQRRKHVLEGLPTLKCSLNPSLTFRGSRYQEVVDELVPYTNEPFFNFGFTLTGEPVIAVADPDANREILTHFDIFPKTRLLQQTLGNGLVFSEGETWKNERRRLTPTFHFGALNDAASYMVEEARSFLSSVTPGKPILAKTMFSSVTLRIIIRYAFGGEFDIGWMEKTWLEFFEQYYLQMLYVQIFGVTLLKYLPFAKSYQLGLKVGEKARDLIAKRRSEARGSATGKNDLVGTLLDAESNGDGVDDDLIIDEVKTFFIGGHETTSNLLAWSSYLMCQHPDKQKLAYQEIESVLGDREISIEDIPKMRYVRAILDETMRLYPVVANLLPRISEQEAEICGKKISQGNVLYCFASCGKLQRKKLEKSSTIFAREISRCIR
eukprot:TRINITY_DN2945_c0_g1_i1.p1 TRINITY_DN2945_c0_g1~~TRINITY_DN2945_c0_g1_i1.p1  ORF type:complete len:403 (-),score=93.86 TRINITY_DN2945_c0_g1_i1:223-1431(-)